ncbi:MAG: hypothetical protein AAFY26_02110 [Cyanobacteria bacterium J06638_22]
MSGTWSDRRHDWHWGGQRSRRLAANTAVTGSFYGIMASGEGCTIGSVIGTTDDWSGFPLIAGQFLPFGHEEVTSITLSEGSGAAFER